MTAPLRVGLLGPFVSRNLGDTAIQMAMIRAIRARAPRVSIIGICTEPDDTRAIHDIASLPFTWERDEQGTEPYSRVHWRARSWLQRITQLPRVLRLVRDVDLLVISGGGQLDEFWGGPLRQPYLLWIWTLAARLRRVPVVAFSVGWDYVRTALGKYFCVNVMRSAALRFVRDEGSLRALRKEGLRGDVSVIPDAAFGLAAHDVSVLPARLQPRRFVVVSPISENAVPPEHRAMHSRHMAILSAACAVWIEKDFDICFLCSQPVMDGPWIGALTTGLPRDRGREWRVQRESTVDSYVAAVNGASFVLAGRLHGLILALVAGTPVIGLNYSRKIGQLLTDFSLSDALIEPGTMTADALVGASRRILAREDAIRADIVQHLTAARRELNAAHDAMMGLVGT